MVMFIYNQKHGSILLWIIIMQVMCIYNIFYQNLIHYSVNPCVTYPRAVAVASAGLPAEWFNRGKLDEDCGNEL